MQSVPHGGWYYEQLELGMNYRMTDMQAALISSMSTQTKCVHKPKKQKHQS